MSAERLAAESGIVSDESAVAEPEIEADEGAVKEPEKESAASAATEGDSVETGLPGFDGLLQLPEMRTPKSTLRLTG